MSRSIKIAVASGKGGTGKTTIATNLAVVLSQSGERVAYVDCDVEEPNGHIFLNPIIHQSREVSILVPEVDESCCTYCGACGKSCRYSAILALPQKVLTFPKLCHGCGGCSLACPENAIHEVPRTTGIVEEGISGPVTFLHGKLNIGEAMAPPVIRSVLNSVPDGYILVLDAPPGTSCPVIESVKMADVVLLVTEPTPFGLNDLKLAVEMVRELGIPFGVAVNRAGIGNNEVFDYCANERIPVILQVPNDRQIAHAYSRGMLAVNALPQLETLFRDLFVKLEGLAASNRKKNVLQRGSVEITTSEFDLMPSDSMPSTPGNDIGELVIISGKGGTGKTSIVASLFALAEQAAVADCDVDAADLHLVLEPSVQKQWPFSGGKTAVIDPECCRGCGICVTHCRFDAIRIQNTAQELTYTVDPISCEGCGVCVDICPEQAAQMLQTINGEWFVSKTRHGPMVHARLGIAQENSGKLVSLVRKEGKALSYLNQRKLLICDGSPGIGCPVIASIAGARMALVVTEPTLSGLHDLKRVAKLCQQFNIKTGICINKVDINPEISDKIEEETAKLNLPIWGRIRYDESVTTAQVKRKAVVENGEGLAATDILSLWQHIQSEFQGA